MITLKSSKVLIGTKIEILRLTGIAADNNEDVSEDNILDERTRGAGPEDGYKEPEDDEGLE